MLVRLKNFLKPSASEASFNQKIFGLNQTHNTLHLQALTNMYNQLSEERKRVFIQKILTGLTQSNWVYQIKCYMVLHYFLIHSQATSFQDRLITTQFKSESSRKKNDTIQWIKTQMIKSYHNYLIKLSLNSELYQCINKSNQKIKYQESFMQEINKNFKHLNLMRQILQLKTKFQKIGRYYPQYLVIIDLFKMYTRDMRLYYTKVKITITHIFDYYLDLNDEQIVHGFHFINEALTISDRLYEFFYNRYFYAKLTSSQFPSFYKLDYDKYRLLQKDLHKRKIFIDYKAYQNSRKSNKQNIKERLNKTLCCTQNFFTAQTIINCNTVGELQEQSYQQVVFSNQL